MTDLVNNRSLLPPELFVQEETAQIASPDDNRLTQEDFFALLTEQLSQQDPTQPVNNDQMVAQMTAFTQAESLSQLNDKFDAFAQSMTSNQALQASSLIGQNVLMLGNQANLGESGGLQGVLINQATAQDVQITIEDGLGQVVRTLNVGTQAEGNIQFNWDGNDESGNRMPPGEYRVRAQGLINNQGEQIATATYRQVNSVSLASSNQGIILNLDGDRSARLDDVLEIGGV